MYDLGEVGFSIEGMAVELELYRKEAACAGIKYMGGAWAVRLHLQPWSC